MSASLSPRARAAISWGGNSLAQYTPDGSGGATHNPGNSVHDVLCVSDQPAKQSGGFLDQSLGVQWMHYCERRGQVVIYRKRLSRLSPDQAKLTWLHENLHNTSVFFAIRSEMHKKSINDIQPVAGSKDEAAKKLMVVAAMAEKQAMEAEATAEEICNLLIVCPRPPDTQPTKLCRWHKKVKNLCDDFAYHVSRFEKLHQEFDTGLANFVANQSNGAQCATSITISGTDMGGANKTSGSFSLNDTAATLDRYQRYIDKLKLKVAAVKATFGTLEVWSS